MNQSAMREVDQIINKGTRLCNDFIELRIKDTTCAEELAEEMQTLTFMAVHILATMCVNKTSEEPDEAFINDAFNAVRHSVKRIRNQDIKRKK